MTRRVTRSVRIHLNASYGARALNVYRIYSVK